MLEEVSNSFGAFQERVCAVWTSTRHSHQHRELYIIFFHWIRRLVTQAPRCWVWGGKESKQRKKERQQNRNLKMRNLKLHGSFHALLHLSACRSLIWPTTCVGPSMTSPRAQPSQLPFPVLTEGFEQYSAWLLMWQLRLCLLLWCWLLDYKLLLFFGFVFLAMVFAIVIVIALCNYTATHTHTHSHSHS